jgi:putative ABC transport system permease protein
VDGIRYRLFRAAVTVAVIAVAVAFLMNILAEGLIKRRVARDTRERIAEMRLVYDWAARLTKAPALETVIRELARVTAADAAYQETQVLTGLDTAGMAEFHRQVCTAESCLVFFDELDYGRRRNLVYTAVGVDAFDRLASSEGWQAFQTALREMKSLRFVMPLAEFQSFLTAWPGLRTQIEQVRDGRARAIAQVREALAERGMLEALAEAEGAFGEAVRQAGFRLDAELVAPVVAAQARRILDIRVLDKSIEARQLRQAIAQRRNILPGDVTAVMMWQILESHSGAEWYYGKMVESQTAAVGLSPERLQELAKQRKEEQLLQRAERLTTDLGRGWMGLGKRMGWLLLVSMLVCGIGIANAMLMTVTERFREIATMKCLGALDGFIMIMFVLEASFLGVAGGAVGAVMGGVIGLGRMAVAFRLSFGQLVPVGDLLGGMAMAVVAGIVLAAVAAVYPSLKAAQLAPMEAMRIE